MRPGEELVSGSVPNKRLRTVNPAEAVKAYDGLMTFTNTVKADPGGLTPARLAMGACLAISAEPADRGPS